MAVFATSANTPHAALSRTSRPIHMLAVSYPLSERQIARDRARHRKDRPWQGCTLRARGRLGGQTHEQRGGVRSCEVSGDPPQRTDARTAQPLKNRSALVRGDRDRPLPASLTFDRMGLVNHPMTNRRQDLSVRRDIAEEQRMVGYHHIRAGGAAARPVDHTFVGVKGAQPPSAFA